MKPDDIEALANVLNEAGIGWMLLPDRATRLQRIATEIRKVSRELDRRLAPRRIDLLGEVLAQPSELKPLVQLFALPTTPVMRAMVYCVLRGMDIQSIDFTYRIKDSVGLRVTVYDDVTDAPLVFESSEAWDTEILRHIAIMKLSGRPVLGGFYSFLP